MKKKALFTVPISIILAAFIFTTYFLAGIKPETAHISTAQKLAEYSKPAVVRVVNYAIVEWKYPYPNDTPVINFFEEYKWRTIIGGSGSGAIISANGYIVTNAHVVEFNEMSEEDLVQYAFEQMVTDLAEYNGWNWKETYKYMAGYVQYLDIKRILKVVTPGGEILDAEVKSYGAPVGEGKDVAVIKVEGKNLPTLKLGDSDGVQNQDDIWVIGYPAAAESDVLSPDSQLVSSMNAGQISATSKKSAQGSPVLQINAAATHGNSGGPVINKEGLIIGLLTFRGDTVNGQEVQGFNFVVPVNTVKEFVSQSGARNKQSDTDKLYKEGLELFWGGYYKDALKKFEDVKRLYSKHSEVDRFITNSQSKSSKSKTLWSNYKSHFMIFNIVAGILIIFLIVFTFIGNNKKKAASAQNTTQSETQATASTPKKSDSEVTITLPDGLENLDISILKQLKQQQEELMKKQQEEQLRQQMELLKQVDIQELLKSLNTNTNYNNNAKKKKKGVDLDLDDVVEDVLEENDFDSDSGSDD